MNVTPRIRDVARAAGVSVGTVSNVLNHPDQVAEGTRERVQRIIDELGFVRNESARQLRAGSSRAVGLVVLDAANPFFTDVARGVENAVHETGGVVLLGNSAGDPVRERRYLELFEQQRVRGVLLVPCEDATPDLAAFRRLGIPVVLIDRASSSPRQSSVSVDDIAGGRLAGGHLISCGHRRIVFVGGPSSLRQVHERVEGLHDAVSGTRASVEVIDTSELTTGAGREVADHLAARPPRKRATAVFAANDLVALGLLQGLLAHGMRVPEDVALVGYDDIEFAASAAVPLTSVRQPREELGRAAADLLAAEWEALAAGRKPQRRRMRFTPELVVRASSQR